jgi:hypothetical protein
MVKAIAPLSADFSPRRPGFNIKLFHAGFVVEEVTSEQVYLLVVWFALVRIIPFTLHSPTNDST